MTAILPFKDLYESYRERQGWKERGKEISSIDWHSSNGHNGQSQESPQGLPCGWKEPKQLHHPPLPSQAHLGAGSEMEQPGTRAGTHMGWDGGIVEGGLTCYGTTSPPVPAIWGVNHQMDRFCLNSLSAFQINKE